MSPKSSSLHRSVCNSKQCSPLTCNRFAIKSDMRSVSHIHIYIYIYIYIGFAAKMDFFLKNDQIALSDGVVDGVVDGGASICLGCQCLA